MTDFAIILRSLTSRKFSTVVTVLTVAVAVALMLVLLSMRHAGEQAFERGAGNMHMIVSAEDSALVTVLNGVFYAGAPRRAIPWWKHQEIVNTFPWEYAVPIQLGDSYRGHPVMATTQEFFTKFEPHPNVQWQPAHGRFFENSFEVVVGATAAQQTGLRVDDTIHLTHGIEAGRQRGWFGIEPDPDAIEPHVHDDFTYRVVGILAPTGSSHDRAVFTNLTSTWIIHAHDRRRERNPAITSTRVEDLTDRDREITGLYLRVTTRPGRALTAVQQEVYNTLRADPAITVADPHHEIRKLFAIISDIDQILLAMAIVVMISSGIGIMLALYNSMDQRRRQIAIMRVLGCSRSRVFGFVMTESALLGLLGALVGVVLCFVGIQVVAELMRQRLGLHIDPFLEPVWTFVLVMATILLAAVSGLIPAMRAYLTPVVANLRPIA